MKRCIVCGEKLNGLKGFWMTCRRPSCRALNRFYKPKAYYDAISSLRRTHQEEFNVLFMRIFKEKIRSHNNPHFQNDRQ